MYKGKNFLKYVESNKDNYEDEEKHGFNVDPRMEYTEEDYALDNLKQFTHTIGKTKIDKTMRISLISEIANILDARPGEEIEYVISNLEIKIRKITTPFKGFDIGQDIIKENTVEYVAEKKIETDLEQQKKKEMKNPSSKNYEEIKKEYLESRRKNGSE